MPPTYLCDVNMSLREVEVTSEVRRGQNQHWDEGSHVRRLYGMQNANVQYDVLN
jgi:hypothetical protein